MIILGFDDNYTNSKTMTDTYPDRYKGALGQDAIDRLREFIDTQQGVMFTHDTIHFEHNRLLTQNFAEDVGQVLYQKNPPVIGANGNNFWGVWTAGLAGVASADWNNSSHLNRDKKVDDSINKYDPKNTIRQ